MDGRHPPGAAAHLAADAGSQRPSGTNLVFPAQPALKCRPTFRLPLRGKDGLSPRAILRLSLGGKAAPWGKASPKKCQAALDHPTGMAPPGQRSFDHRTRLHSIVTPGPALRAQRQPNHPGKARRGSGAPRSSRREFQPRQRGTFWTAALIIPKDIKIRIARSSARPTGRHGQSVGRR